MLIINILNEKAGLKLSFELQEQHLNIKLSVHFFLCIICLCRSDGFVKNREHVGNKSCLEKRKKPHIKEILTVI